MNSIDFHYYKNIGGNRQPAYDFENLILTAGCNFEDIHFGLDGHEFDAEAWKRHGYFVHEFIHHVQNFATNWGATIFADFVLAYSKIAASYVNGEIIEIPPVGDRGENQLLWQGYDDWLGVHNRIKKSFFVKTEEKNKVNPIVLIEESDNTISFDNGRVRAKVGLQVIREHMADLGALLFCGLTDQQIQQHHRSFESFLYEGELTYDSQYWIVFEFFKEQNNYQKLALGILRLMNECLTRLNPDQAFFRFIQFWKVHPDKKLLGKVFEEFVLEWRTDPTEINSFNFSFNKVIQHIEDRLRFVNSVNENDLTLAAKGILEQIYQNVNVTRGGRDLFKGDSLNNPSNWYNFITYYGSPIVAFIDQIKVLGTEEYCKSNTDFFIRINSVSMAMKKLHEDREFQCPFLWDIPICKANFKGESTCVSTPFLQITKDETGGSCNFRNGILLLRLEDRIKFS